MEVLGHALKRSAKHLSITSAKVAGRGWTPNDPPRRAVAWVELSDPFSLPKRTRPRL